MDRPDPCTLVIIGASGDLTERKTIPALFDLFRRGEMPTPFRVVGCARTHFEEHQIFKLTSWWLMDLTAH
ncbi:MAG: hypothetical protein R6X27_07720 [Candidatus Desulfacyla sp.]